MLRWIAVTAALLCTPVQATTPPDELVRMTSEKLSKTIRDRHAEFKAKPEVFYAEVEAILVPRFDLKYIAQLILARSWKEASDEQRTRFQVAFKNMLIRSYANTLLDFNDSVKAEWLPLQAAADASEVTVKSKLLRKSGPPVAIGFAMRLKDGDWKVYDITVESISLISSFRSQVASQIKKDGIEALITKLEKGDGFGKLKDKEG